MIAERDPLIGQELDGYFIEGILAQGGMARVYLGRDVRLGRHVVVKVIKPGARSNQDYRARFEIEAQAIALLEHPHIVRIYRFGEVGDLYYMAMQYIEGADLNWILRDYSADNELLQHEDVLRIVSQVGSALDYAHSQGIIHRDVKPANIMLDIHGNATLTDFGLALLEAKDVQGEIFGTPHYMAPELTINSAGATPQSDLYSLGVILYEMLTGSLPFTGNTAMEIALLHRNEPPPSPLERNPGLHPAFVPVLDKALEKQPAQRYESSHELAMALSEAMCLAMRTPQQAQTTLLHVSRREIPEKVSKFRQQHHHAPARPSAAHPPVPTLRVPQTNNPLPIPTYEHRGQRRWWPFGILGAGIIISALAILLSGLLRSNSVEDMPTEIPEARAATGEFTPTPQATIQLTPIAPTISPTVQAEPPTTIPVSIPASLGSAPVLPTPGAINLTPTLVAIRFVVDGEDSLYVINISPMPFNLGLLELRGAQGGVMGSEWGVPLLNNQECVRIQKDENARTPDVTCTAVGLLLTRDGPERFWKPEFDSFEVYYAGAFVGNCPTTGCILPLPAS
jgi:serine/threonine protein kinase